MPSNEASCDGSDALSMKETVELPFTKSPRAEVLSFAVLSATTPAVPAQVAFTAAGRKCSALNELDTCSCGSVDGQPDDSGAYPMATTAELSGVMTGPFPSPSVAVSSVTTSAHGLDAESQLNPGWVPLALTRSCAGINEFPWPAGS